MKPDASIALLANEIVKTPTPSAGITSGVAPLARQFGMVTAVNGGPPVTVSLTLGGSTTIIDGIPCWTNFTPVVGQMVVIDKSGDTLMVIGSSQAVSGGNTPVSFPLSWWTIMGFRPDNFTFDALLLLGHVAVFESVVEIDNELTAPNGDPNPKSLALVVQGGIQPGNSDTGVAGYGPGLYGGSGAPTDTIVYNGRTYDGPSNGDLFFRKDGGAGTTIYQRQSGVWTGIL